MSELRRTSSGSANLGLVPMFFFYFSIVVVIVICEPFAYYCIATSYFDCTDVGIEQVTC